MTGGERVPRLRATAPTASGQVIERHEHLAAMCAAARLLPEEEGAEKLRSLARRWPAHFEPEVRYVVALVVELPVAEREDPSAAWEAFAPEVRDYAGTVRDVLYVSDPLEVTEVDVATPEFHAELYSNGERCSRVAP